MGRWDVHVADCLILKADFLQKLLVHPWNRPSLRLFLLLRISSLDGSVALAAVAAAGSLHVCQEARNARLTHKDPTLSRGSERHILSIHPSLLLPIHTSLSFLPSLFSFFHPFYSSFSLSFPHFPSFPIFFPLSFTLPPFSLLPFLPLFSSFSLIPSFPLFSSFCPFFPSLSFLSFLPFFLPSFPLSFLLSLSRTQPLPPSSFPSSSLLPSPGSTFGLSVVAANG